jgi:predicted nucleic acid-binding protein
VATRERKYALDTNLFIDAFRDEACRVQLERFHAAFAPFEHLSAIVLHELCAGAQRPEDLARLEQHVFRPFQQRGRVFTPTRWAWQSAGELLSTLATAEGTGVTRSFGNDVLLALSCRESGICLVTANARDFAAIRRHADFEFVPPWPESRS